VSVIPVGRRIENAFPAEKNDESGIRSQELFFKGISAAGERTRGASAASVNAISGWDDCRSNFPPLSGNDGLQRSIIPHLGVLGEQRHIRCPYRRIFVNAIIYSRERE